MSHNPLIDKAVGSIIRAGLAVLAGYVVQHGLWTSSDAETYVAAATLAIISLGWSLWEKYGSQLKLVTALSMPPGSSEKQLEAVIKNPGIEKPPAALPKNEAPAPLRMTGGPK